MRLIGGHDLQDVLTDGAAGPAPAVRIVDQVAKALQAAHRVGLPNSAIDIATQATSGSITVRFREIPLGEDCMRA